MLSIGGSGTPAWVEFFCSALSSSSIAEKHLDQLMLASKGWAPHGLITGMLDVASLQHAQPLPHMLSEEKVVQVKPEQILGYRHNSAVELDVLVQWRNLPVCENSLKSAVQLQETFLTFHLEDKVNLLEGGWVSIGRNQSSLRPVRGAVGESQRIITLKLVRESVSSCSMF